MAVQYDLSHLISIEGVRKLKSTDPKIQAEIQARIRWHEFFSEDPYITGIAYTDPVRDPYHPADAFLLSAGTRFLAEVKSRNATSKRYRDWWIEARKLDDFTKLIKGQAIKPLHVSIFCDDRALIWPMDDHQGVRSHFAPVSTAIEFSPKRSKDFLVYNTSDAQIIDLPVYFF